MAPNSALMLCKVGALEAVAALHSTPTASPYESPFLESFNSRFRDEFLNIELFTSLQEAKLLTEQHRIKYNTHRPHSALRGRTPWELLHHWKTA